MSDSIDDADRERFVRVIVEEVLDDLGLLGPRHKPERTKHALVSRSALHGFVFPVMAPGLEDGDGRSTRPDHMARRVRDRVLRALDREGFAVRKS